MFVKKIESFESLNIESPLLQTEEQTASTVSQSPPMLDFELLQENPLGALCLTATLAGAAALIYYGSIKDRL